MPINRIITKGMGTSNGLAQKAGLTPMGYGGLYDIWIRGRSRESRELSNYWLVVEASLIGVNDVERSMKGSEVTQRLHEVSNVRVNGTIDDSRVPWLRKCGMTVNADITRIVTGSWHDNGRRNH